MDRSREKDIKRITELSLDYVNSAGVKEGTSTDSNQGR